MPVSAVVRLVTFVEATDDGADPRQMRVAARHEAELDDRRRVLLLDGRGWTSSVRGPVVASSHPSLEEIEQTARAVVGPDEPFGGRSHEDMEADHWAHLAGILGRHGIAVDPAELAELPHDVELGDRLRARIAGS